MERVGAALTHFCVMAVAAVTWLDPLALAEPLSPAAALLVLAADDPDPELEQPARTSAPLMMGMANIRSRVGPVMRDFIFTYAPGSTGT
jgi:hypothetical protein